MRLMPSLVIITNFIVSQVKAASWVKSTHEACQDFTEVYYDVMEKCLNHGLVTYPLSLACYELHTPGPCDDGEILVFVKGPCLQTQCVPNRDSEGTPCQDGWFNYKGTCTGSQGCAGQFGRRVRPDLYGDVQCVCDRELGFIEFEGECHFEFLRGPCQHGEQLIRDLSESPDTKCVKNICDTPWFMLARPIHGTQNVCDVKEDFLKNFNRSLLTSDEIKKVEEGKVSLVPFSVFTPSCHTVVAQSTGECLESAVEPGLSSHQSLLLNIRTHFNLTGPKQTDVARLAEMVTSTLLVNGIKLDSDVESWIRLSEVQECQDFKRFYFEAMGRCLENGTVVDKDLHDCYKLLSEGPCDNGEILVFTKGPCLQTQCVPNRDSEGIPCQDGWFNYKGTCTEAGSQGCADQFGRRVRPDLYGDLQCVCDQELGFVEFEGECYFEFLRGPCQHREQLIVDISKTLESKCAKNSCNINEGYILQRFNETQYVCSKKEAFYRKYNQSLSLMTDEEAEEFKADFDKFENEDVDINEDTGISTVPFNTFNNCNKRAHATGGCLGTEKEPQPNTLNLILNIRKAFNIPPQENVETLVFVEREDYNNGTLVDVATEILVMENATSIDFGLEDNFKNGTSINVE